MGVGCQYRPLKCKGKIHPITGHEDPEGEQRNSSTLSLTQIVVGSRRHAAAALPQERPGTHCTGGWVRSWPVRTGTENLSPTKHEQ